MNNYINIAMNHFKYFNKLSKDSEKIKYLKTNKLALYEVICTFDEGEQIIVDIIVEDESEKNLVFSVFKAMNKKEIISLVKLSFMRLYTKKIEDLPEFIQKNNGKYYEKDLIKYKKLYLMKKQ
ncbi:hypothetical protein Catovirus_1_428 [Catovirus CTV1]|uniref:Uncharacterized protein n=1 Tax=Catovirus CTV1 TaxID=1977631 RepID=A0A1V0S9Q2_9VIRU|nr:hypothetical protein Catovirus_1_428 [Catovirus CTV1]